MGLDMYLEIRKNEYCSKYYKDKGCKMKLEYPKDITEFIPNPTDLRISRQTNYELLEESESHSQLVHAKLRRQRRVWYSDRRLQAGRNHG